jgi:hypothetical protein
MKETPEAPQNPRARITGVVYLLYFLLAVFAEFLNGRKLPVCSDAFNLLAFACYIILAILFFYLFKPVNRLLSLIAALFSILGCVVGVIGLFDPAAISISPLVFFGPYCILIGYLILRSTFLPRILGLLMVFAGLGWLAFLSPLGKYLTLYIEILGILAEALLMLWLMVKGVNIQKWKEQAGEK